MLEVKDLTKVYTGKGGVVTRALDGVSVVFPEKGMVFLLGKSGSGKSTLLNVAGGLDKPDGGEVIVKGRSSKDFSGSDFDSYRNTFIGFVFQEYNILNEFTIEQNISLALQLQNKPNNKQAVEDLLKKVDLVGYGKRKPNTLSGGQKQRVAIARALIKEPEIIMADEPTGALDSTTGKQVLDTLKKLSQEKLVIVVSHDRDFAEFYGDRIIELKDGKVISDVSKTYSEPQDTTENVSQVSEDTITIKKGSDITDEDVKRIAEMLRQSEGEAIITTSARELPDVKRACKINDSGAKESFKDTEEVEIASYDGSKTKFIKSHLPMGHAIKMGASGLRTKPIRLIFTIILAVAAFILFGVVSTFMLYDPDYSVSEALKEANYPNVTVDKHYTYTRTSYRVNNKTGEEEVDYTDDDDAYTLFTAEEIAAMNKNGLNFAGIYTFNNSTYSNASRFNMGLMKDGSYTTISLEDELREYYSVTDPMGVTDCGEAYLRRNGFSITGDYPANEKEIMLSEYFAELFVNTTACGVANTQEMIGKKVRLSNSSGMQVEFTVTGIVKTGEIPASYAELKKTGNLSEKERDTLSAKLRDYLSHGYESLIYVSADFYDAYSEYIPKESSGPYIPSQYVTSLRMESTPSTNGIEEWDGSSFYTENTLEKYAGSFVFKNLDGSVKTDTSFNEDEIYISENRYYDMLRNAVWQYDLNVRYDPDALTEIGYSEDETEYWIARNNIYNGNSHIKTVFEYIDKWYAKLAYKDYLYNAGQMIYWDVYNKESKTAAEESFLASYDAINAYANKSKDDVVAAPTAAQWNALESYINARFASEDAQRRYGILLEKALGRFGFDSFAGKEDEVDPWNIVSGLKNNDYSAEDFALLKTKIDAYFAQFGLTADPATFFTFDSSKLVQYIYYCDKASKHGKLKVVGYIENMTNAEYCVKESFLTAHGVINKDENEYSWYSAETTDYVMPAGAKYNKAISLTNNSIEQIAVANAKEGAVFYRIDNNVMQSLDYFLNLIEMLEKIFLYVGLGVGLIAALFLLNFISVSISAKRKDIGILRAVGARGSDVFKIFYAEAFIIAIICFLIACVGSFFVCFFLNRSISEVLNMQVLHFGPINGALILGISIVISLIATFFPVYFAAKKSPVESIRAL
ncbi:MAG: ATP-binding cassette domain-containing protein [Clostridia bacterium]|nr:ATP-binding cassette domain-containing protein [Clostridia bacterium]